MLGLAAILAHPEAKQDPPTLPISKLNFIFRHLEHVNKTTAILSFSSLAVLIAARVLKQAMLRRPGTGWVRFVPEILLVVAGTTGKLCVYQARCELTLAVLNGMFRWDLRGVEVLGRISGGTDFPFGWPLDRRRLKYFNYTVSPSSTFVRLAEGRLAVPNSIRLCCCWYCRLGRGSAGERLEVRLCR